MAVLHRKLRRPAWLPGPMCLLPGRLRSGGPVLLRCKHSGFATKSGLTLHRCLHFQSLMVLRAASSLLTFAPSARSIREFLSAAFCGQMLLTEIFAIMNKTLFLSQTADGEAVDQPQGEARMREALGLRTDGSRMPASSHRPERVPDHGSNNPRRHRFVQEGEVPVEIMTFARSCGTRRGGPGNISRHRVDDNALAAEKMAREQAERAFHENI